MKSFSKIVIDKISLIILIMIVLFCNIIITMPNKVYAASYNQVVINANSNNNNGIDAFPESYKVLLQKLVSQTGHTNWKFKPFYTDISWNELTSTRCENACYRNTVYKGNDSRWYCSGTHNKPEYGGDGYYCASGRIVNYYLDPRNFLTETTIFQFVDLSNNSPASIDDIKKALRGSFMEGNCSTGESYANIIYDAAAASGENALSIIAKIYQEIGSNSPGNPPTMASGTSGYYNFFNYGATDGSGAITRGIDFARRAGWNSERTSIVEGAKLISSSYIQAGQNTKYTFKFDVVGSEKGQLYEHQYMTNIQDPTNQAKILFDKYTNNGWLTNDLTFVIPVYKDMPAAIKKPSNLTSGDLYYVSSNYYTILYRSSPNGSELGSLSKDTVVKMLERNVKSEGGYSWDKIQLENGQVAYMADEYLSKINTSKDNYYVPGQPSEQTGNTVNVTYNFKAEDGKFVTEPGTTLKTIKEKYSVVSAKKDGRDVQDTDNLGTGTVVTTNNGTFTVVKIGDISGDGKIDSMDMYQMIQHLLGNKVLTDYRYKASDINKDGRIDSMDMYNVIQFLLGNSKISV